MIRDGNQVRFTADEIDQFRAVGLDVSGVRRIEDFGRAVAKWRDLLNETRPDLLEKLARIQSASNAWRYVQHRYRTPAECAGSPFSTGSSRVPGPAAREWVGRRSVSLAARSGLRPTVSARPANVPHTLGECAGGNH